MAQEQWIVIAIEQLIETSRDYKDIALLEATKKLLEEQEVKLEQLSGELDGTLWSPSNWLR